MPKETFHVIECLNYRTEKNEFRAIRDSNYIKSRTNLANQNIFFCKCVTHTEIAQEANLLVKQFTIPNMVKQFHPN